MNKQTLLFADCATEVDQKYSKKIEAPVYEPRHDKPHLMTLCDSSKVKALIREIDASSLPDEEKAFLRAAAWRHAVFHYERIADYYAHASPEMQRLMEASALVIIDFDAAIERGFVKLCDDIREQYLEEYNAAAT
ncbi:MAG TPA: hypothetical protein PLI86_00265 [bacterium]|nr:hypothetical protein [bacterium]